jgi:hypothetical protein
VFGCESGDRSHVLESRTGTDVVADLVTGADGVGNLVTRARVVETGRLCLVDGRMVFVTAGNVLKHGPM